MTICLYKISSEPDGSRRDPEKGKDNRLIVCKLGNQIMLEEYF